MPAALIYAFTGFLSGGKEVIRFLVAGMQLSFCVSQSVSPTVRQDQFFGIGRGQKAEI